MACFALLPGLLVAPAAGANEPSRGTLSSGGENGQRLVLRAGSSPSVIDRDEITIMPAAEAIADSGSTNEDWAKLVLADGNWPITDHNVTTILRWMDSENAPQSWWNRNNPLNNGYGSGGGGGFGSYPSLAVAAQNVAWNLHRNSLYVAIVSALDASAAPSVTARAIMQSPWASSHYGYGSRWHAVDVPVVAAPDWAW